MDQEFEWDEDKRLSTIDKHGLDFLRIRQLFDGRPTFSSVTTRDGEQRIITTGELADRLYTVIWTERVGKIHGFRN